MQVPCLRMVLRVSVLAVLRCWRCWCDGMVRRRWRQAVAAMLIRTERPSRSQPTGRLSAYPGDDAIGYAYALWPGGMLRSVAAAGWRVGASRYMYAILHYLAQTVCNRRWNPDPQDRDGMCCTAR